MKARTLATFARLCQTNFLEFIRDRVASFFSILFPVGFVIFFGVVSSYHRSPTVSMAVVDRENSEISKALVARLGATPGLKLSVLAPDATETTEILARGKFAGMVVIPKGSCQGVIDGGAAVRLYAPAEFEAYLQMALDTAHAQLLLAESGTEPLFRYEIAAPPRRPVNGFAFMLPGFMALALLNLAITATASPLISARARGTLRHLAVTPVSSGVFIAAQLTLRFLTGMLQLVLVLGVGMLLFGATVAGSFVALLAVAVLGTAMLLAIAYALAGIVPARAASLVMLANFAMMFLGQIFWDVSAVWWLAPLTKLVPTTYLAESFRQVMTGAQGYHSLPVNMAIMAGITVLAVTVATRTFRFAVRI